AADDAGHPGWLRAGVCAERRPVLPVGYHGRRPGAGGQPHPRPAAQGARLERRFGHVHGAHRAVGRALPALPQGRRRWSGGVLMAAKRRKKRKIFSPVYLTLVLIVLYLPILMVVIYSFN